ncbi:patatin-like phospholipase family protein [Streptomyces sp. NPDC051578]|uniref:patatin-like phospholipase family protein n=1 Tax=Streptomyces sp. NPDC051578 TaxID=3365662 RepID=UPI00379153EE
MAASTAFPGTYPPITINGRRYMDGSLRSAINAAIAPGARTLAVIDHLTAWDRSTRRASAKPPRPQSNSASPGRPRLDDGSGYGRSAARPRPC